MIETEYIDLADVDLSRVPHDMGGLADLSDVEDYLDSLPPADVAPVVYAHWETVTERVPVMIHRRIVGVEQEKARCSRCRETNKNYRPPFCPHCGAIMTKEVSK